MINAVAGPEGVVVGAGVAAKRRPRELSPTKEQRRAKVIRSLTDPAALAEDERSLEREYYGIAEAFRPRNRWQEWVAARIATLVVRINRAERVERKLRDWASYRAFDFWEDDQKLAVEALGHRLKRDPAKVAARLRQSPAGLDWLAGRWQGLAKLGPEDWTDERRELAAQLLGGDERVDPATPGFVAAQVEAIEADRVRVEEADALLRGLVESDLSDANVPDLARLRREVRGWHREMKWYADQFHVDHSDRWDDPMRRPASEKVKPDEFREVNYHYFEGPRVPDLGPAPAPSAPAPPAVESLSDGPGHESDETNPITPLASFSAAICPAAPAVQSSARGGPDEESRGPSRPQKGGKPSREDARRLKRARRRASLDLVERL